MTEFAGPRSGAGGGVFTSVPVYAEYAEAAVCAFNGAYRPPSMMLMMLMMVAGTNFLEYPQDNFIRLSDFCAPPAGYTNRFASSSAAMNSFFVDMRS
jgi:hypothetical protein